MKRMMHPLNGYDWAYNTVDEARLRSLGWVEDDGKWRDEPAPQVDPVPVQDEYLKEDE